MTDPRFTYAETLQHEPEPEGCGLTRIVVICALASVCLCAGIAGLWFA